MTYEVLDSDEVERLARAALSVDLRALVAVMLGVDAGLRRGEIRGLAWDDVDFVTERIFVRRFRHSNDPAHPYSAPMHRIVPMTRRLVRILAQQRSRRQQAILEAPGASPVTDSMLGTWLAAAAQRAGIPAARRFHTLRRTFMALLFQKGVDADVIAQLAGRAPLFRHLAPTPWHVKETAVALLEHGHELTDLP